MAIIRTLFTSILMLWLSTTVHAHEDVYDPLAVGMSWLADVTMTAADGKTTQGTATRKITGTEVIDGKTYFVEEVGMEGLPYLKPFTTYRRKTPQGVVSIGAADLKKVESLDMPFPLTVGKTWEITSDSGKTLFKVEGFVDSLNVGTKQYHKCFKISYRTDNTDFNSVFYLAPDIGNVSETMKFGGMTFVFTHRTLTKSK